MDVLRDVSRRVLPFHTVSVWSALLILERQIRNRAESFPLPVDHSVEDAQLAGEDRKGHEQGAIPLF